jgi:hypothetical protein
VWNSAGSTWRNFTVEVIGTFVFLAWFAVLVSCDVCAVFPIVCAFPYSDLCDYYEHLRKSGAAEHSVHPQCLCKWLFADKLASLGITSIDVSACAVRMPEEYKQWKMSQSSHKQQIDVSTNNIDVLSNDDSPSELLISFNYL